MNEIIFAANKAIWLILILTALPVTVATTIGLLVGLFQTVTQLQEQTLPFGIKLLGVCICLFLISGWIGETLVSYTREIFHFALKK
ncbi:EscS/YscS/HrcS family type III secretion system export apparatus protein [Pantoea sp. SORGH_AS_0659]|uniref:EscS/YscS/HrcS family type III secretion system export apparatus protein n=1 Tax=Pantoea sp. SORGH_AS_0659 TaxID=3062597 RepID=UPI002857724A|nr:EscS/YscS/HrcS family type III secretion system export apparatus protein [Pantoea sp. SORGH_AS_0659]MDR6352526.1 type III secretion HrpO family protein [Pantoea sp. SORGH_AS_0659]